MHNMQLRSVVHARRQYTGTSPGTAAAEGFAARHAAHDNAAMLDDESHHQGSTRRLGIAALLTGGFMVAEAIGGYLAGSLALMADAGHMLADTGALTMAWAAARLARRPADSLRSYGYERIRVLAAMFNSAALLVLVAWLVVEAVQRLLAPQQVDARLMLVIALIGAALNVGVALLLRHDHDHDINLNAAYLHVLSDLGGSLAATLGAVIILTTGWTRADPLLSLVIGALIARVAIRLLRRSTHILMEGTPEGLESHRLAAEVREAVPGIEDVHHVHAWSLGSRDVLLTLHARIRPGQDPEAALRGIKLLLSERYGITHSTVQLEDGHCVDRPRLAG
jgi:cobalt-zinc-cadmium efflux system protein